MAMDYSSFVLNVVNGYKLSLLNSPIIAKKELDFTIIRIKTKIHTRCCLRELNSRGSLKSLSLLQMNVVLMAQQFNSGTNFYLIFRTVAV